MDAAFANGNETYWINGEANPNLALYPNKTGDQIFWINGEPAETLIPFYNKENMFMSF